MQSVQSYLTVGVGNSDAAGGKAEGMFRSDASEFQGALINQLMKGKRLRDQVFAFTVTNQVINSVQEVVFPWAMEHVHSARTKGKLGRRAG